MNATYRRAILMLFLIAAGLWLMACSRCTPDQTAPDGVPDVETEADPPPPPTISTEPTATENWGSIPLPELKASLGFPPELALMDSVSIPQETGKAREIVMARPKNDGRLDLLRFTIREIPRRSDADLMELLEESRRALSDREALTLDLQQVDPWKAGPDGAYEIRQLFHYLDGTDIKRIRRFVWTLPERLIILNFEAEDGHYRSLGVYITRMAEHLRLDDVPAPARRDNP